MQNPFSFLLEMDVDQGKQWLKRFLAGEGTSPAVRVPFDLEPLEFLLGQVNPLREPELPLRIGLLAGALLAEAIIEGIHRTENPQQLGALFTLVESLPVPPEIADFLMDLGVTRRMLPRQDDREIDLHLLVLRALILHQQPIHGDIERMVEFWKMELSDLRYAAVALQGLLRISMAAALTALPEFMRRARTATPPLPIANTLFVVKEELGFNQSLWSDLVRAFEGWSAECQTLKETFAQMRLAETNPVAWAALKDPPPPTEMPSRIAPRYLSRHDASIQRALQLVKTSSLLIPEPAT